MADRKPRPFLVCAMCPNLTTWKVQSTTAWKRTCSRECMNALEQTLLTEVCPGGCGQRLFPWNLEDRAARIAAGEQVRCGTCFVRTCVECQQMRPDVTADPLGGWIAVGRVGDGRCPSCAVAASAAMADAARLREMAASFAEAVPDPDDAPHMRGEALPLLLARIQKLGALVESMLTPAAELPPLHVDQIAYDVRRALREAFPDRAEAILRRVTVQKQ